MKHVFRNVGRYLRLYWKFVQFSVMSQMEYRINFITAFLVETAYLLIKLLYASVPYRAGTDINGWSPDAILLYIGVFTMMSGFYSGLFYSNFTSLPEKIRTGSLDVLMTKPVSLQFMVTLRQFELGYTLPNVIGGGIMTGVGWHRLGLPFNLETVGGFSVLLGCGVLTAYSVFLLPQLLAFWIIRTNGVTELSNSIFETNYVPMAVYSNLIQRIGLFVLPVFVICNFPPMFILGKMEPGLMLWAFLAPLWLLAIIRLIWQFALRDYTSASQ
ncbi:ABC-2 family transporter protein [Paenibacillus sp. M-152]|uniref:ABC transporter permease n=1 Tax=Paenibacillus sp. M-152 TaxID=2487928 RepID=UPI000F6CCD75|nr:ABC-2 family transporter protein [Paenibacillus sp. M-152]AZH30913.1 ABC transporter permease [Paenibacillus sp. M-152]